MAQNYVLDTSAWFALLEDEDGADVVEGLLREAAAGEVEVFTSFMTFMEVEYITIQERGDDVAGERLRLIGKAPSVRIESSAHLARAAAQLKATHRISVADAWIAALAQNRAATLVHKDPEYDEVENVVDVLRLPYRRHKHLE